MTPNLPRIDQAEQIEVILDQALRTVVEFAKQQIATELKSVRHRVQVRNKAMRCKTRHGWVLRNLPEEA